jgi:hypothetical protein
MTHHRVTEITEQTASPCGLRGDRLGGFAVSVTTALAVLLTYRARMGSEFADDSSDARSRTRPLVLVGECPNENLQIDLFVQSEGRLSSMDSTLSGSWSVAFALDSEARRLNGVA